MATASPPASAEAEVRLEEHPLETHTPAEEGADDTRHEARLMHLEAAKLLIQHLGGLVSGGCGRLYQGDRRKGDEGGHLEDLAPRP